jgi:DNA-directed RNA polymerase I subunit RPA1
MQTNHSYALKQRYGIEACRANIVKEIRSVFDVYGIVVNYRHLSLIADFITYSGDYRSFNRIGMEESSSPFLKMSYETTMKYLINSSTTKDHDWITSPSSALVLGQVPRVGTNAFDIIHDTMPVKKSAKTKSK